MKKDYLVKQLYYVRGNIDDKNNIVIAVRILR